MPRPREWVLRDIVDVGLALFLASLLALEALRMFLASVYAMNVLTTGLNASVAALLFLVAPAAYPLGLARARGRSLILVFAVVFLGARILLVVPWSIEVLVVLGGLGVAFYLLFLVPYLAGLLHLAGGGATAATSFGLAFAADVALRSLGNTLDPAATAWSILFLVPLGAAFLYLVAKVPLPEEGPATGRHGSPGLAGLALGGFLSLCVVLLGYPAFLARWTARPAAPFLAAVLLGFLVGAYLAKMGLGPARRAARWSGALQASLLLFAVDLALGGSEFSFLLASLAAAGSVVGLERVLAAYAAPGASTRSLGIVLTIACGIFLVALLAFVFTLTYAYVPAPALWRGHAPAVIVLMALGLGVPALAAGSRTPGVVPTAASRRWLAAASAVLLLTASAGLVLSAPPSPGESPPPATLRVMTYNVHQGFSAAGRLNVERIADVVRTANPAVLVLEESDTVRVTSGGVDLVGYVASTAGYPYVAYGPPTREQTYGVSILSRYPIEGWDYALLTSTLDQRALVHAHIRVGDLGVHVFGVHLGLQGGERERQVREVLNLTAPYPEPKILAGDFNACPSGLCPGPGETPDRVYDLVTPAWTDAWAQANPGSPESSGFTYDSLRPYERIDYVFLAGIVAVRCEVLGNGAPVAVPVDASDHLPVVADLRLPGSP